MRYILLFILSLPLFSNAQIRWGTPGKTHLHYYKVDADSGLLSRGKPVIDSAKLSGDSLYVRTVNGWAYSGKFSGSTGSRDSAFLRNDTLYAVVNGTQYYAGKVAGSQFLRYSDTATNAVLTHAEGNTLVSGKVSGSGTANYLPKFTGTATVGNSTVTDDGDIIESADLFRFDRPSKTLEFGDIDLTHNNTKFTVDDNNQRITLDAAQTDIVGTATVDNNLIVNGNSTIASLAGSGTRLQTIRPDGTEEDTAFSTITTMARNAVSAGSGISYNSTTGVISATGGGGGSADSLFNTLEVGIGGETLDTLIYEDWTTSTITSGTWTPGSGFSSSYSGGITKVNGANQWAPNNNHLVNNQNTPWPGGLQYESKRMPYEDIHFRHRAKINTITDSTVFAVTRGANGFLYSYPNTIAWDVTNRHSQGRVKLGTGAIYNFNEAGDSTARCPISAGDEVIFYFDQTSGGNVTAGIINVTSGKKTVTQFDQMFGGQGGYWNLMTIKGGTAVQDWYSTTIWSDAKKNVPLVFGNSLEHGSGTRAESRRWANRVFQGDYNVVGLPSASGKWVATSGIDTEIYAALTPPLVTIGFVDNDYGEGFTLTEARLGTDSIGTRAQRAGATVVLRGAIPRQNTAVIPYRDTIRDLANDRSWYYLDFWTDFANAGNQVKGSYTVDGIHFTDSGNVVAEKVVTSTIGHLLQTLSYSDVKRVKMHGLRTADPIQVPYLLARTKDSGEVVQIPNYLPNDRTHIKNTYNTGNGTGNEPIQEVQDAAIGIRHWIRNDGKYYTGNSSGVQHSFSYGGSNWDVNNQTIGGLGTGTVFNSLTGQRIRYFDNTGFQGDAQVSGNDIELVNASTDLTVLSGNKVYAYHTNGSIGSMSGNNNLGFGDGALRGITTGTKNLHWFAANPDAVGLGYDFPSGLTGSVMLGGGFFYGSSNVRVPRNNEVLIASPANAGAVRYFTLGALGTHTDFERTRLQIGSEKVGTDTKGEDAEIIASPGKGNKEDGDIKMVHRVPGSSGSSVSTTLDTSASFSRLATRLKNRVYLHKDSTNITSGKTWYLVLDTVTGQIQRQLASGGGGGVQYSDTTTFVPTLSANNTFTRNMTVNGNLTADTVYGVGSLGLRLMSNAAMNSSIFFGSGRTNWNQTSTLLTLSRNSTDSMTIQPTSAGATFDLGLGTGTPVFTFAKSVTISPASAVLTLGNSTDASTTSPAYITLGGTYSPSEGQNLKVRVYESGSARFGLGVSAGQMDYVSPTSSGHAWFSGSTKLARLTSGGTLAIGSSTPAASAKLDVQSTTQGFLPPRMTATQASAISSPAEGLMVYVTDTNGTFTSKGWWGYNGSAWEKLNN
jgi:hypothetical protein